MTYFPPQSGPCIVCGDTNYNLSCGGPTICPKCDCGNFDAATVEKQAKIIAELRAEVASLREANKTFADHAIHGKAQAEQVPVGWFGPWNDYHVYQGYQQVAKRFEGSPGTIPLYTAPAQARQEPVAWQWRYVGELDWKTPGGGAKLTDAQLKNERPIEQRPLVRGELRIPASSTEGE
jgi:hypothetical protein